MNILLPIFITSMGFALWLWSRAGRLPRWPRGVDELDQTMHRPLASPILFLVGLVLIIYGLYKAYLIGWSIIVISFLVGALIGNIIFKLIIRRWL